MNISYIYIWEGGGGYPSIFDFLTFLLASVYVQFLALQRRYKGVTKIQIVTSVTSVTSVTN